MTTPKARPSRARNPKAEAGFAQNLAIEGETKTPDVIQAAYSRGFEDGEAIAKKIAANHSLSIGDLRAKLDETSGIRTRIVAEVDRLSGELAKMQANLIGCDGALQVLGQLIEAVEAKGKAGEA